MAPWPMVPIIAPTPPFPPDSGVGVFFQDLIFFCWRQGRLSAKKIMRNKELISDGLGFLQDYRENSFKFFSLLV